jgi:hypothetical protein
MGAENGRSGHPRALFAVFLLVMACFFGTFTGTPAQASVSPGNAALSWAESPANALGHLYAYGTVGPVTYDCSGLVSTAILKATGKWIGRSTFEMLGTHGHGHLYQVWTPQRGDLAFYGSGHVEFVTKWWHVTFGAHDTGQRIGWIGWWGTGPTMFFRVR